MKMRQDPRVRIYAAVGTAVVAASGMVLIAVALTGTEGPPQPTTSQRGTLSDHHHLKAGKPLSIASHVGPIMSRSRPVRLNIPAISVHSKLLRLGLNPNGTLQVPWKPLLAGWYTKSPTPGEVGPSIIAGHVDSWETGPAVFYRLGQLAPGRRVIVTRADGSRARFIVDGVREYAKAKFPTRLVYGNTDRAQLRLITCGNWNEGRQEYDGNIVVFAHLGLSR